jgi:putative membrane protein
MMPFLDNLLASLPVFLAHVGVTLGMLVVGILAYEAITPYRELELVRAGNSAAGIALGSAILGLAIPLAACLARSVAVWDIVVWGVAALILQLAAFAIVAVVLKRLPDAIAKDETGAACVLASVQLAVALVIAAAVGG